MKKIITLLSIVLLLGFTTKEKSEFKTIRWSAELNAFYDVLEIWGQQQMNSCATHYDDIEIWVNRVWTDPVCYIVNDVYRHDNDPMPSQNDPWATQYYYSTADIPRQNNDPYDSPLAPLTPCLVGCP